MTCKRLILHFIPLLTFFCASVSFSLCFSIPINILLPLIFRSPFVSQNPTPCVSYFAYVSLRVGPAPYVSHSVCVAPICVPLRVCSPYLCPTPCVSHSLCVPHRMSHRCVSHFVYSCYFRYVWPGCMLYPVCSIPCFPFRVSHLDCISFRVSDLVCPPPCVSYSIYIPPGVCPT